MTKRTSIHQFRPYNVELGYQVLAFCAEINAISFDNCEYSL